VRRAVSGYVRAKSGVCISQEKTKCKHKNALFAYTSDLSSTYMCAGLCFQEGGGNFEKAHGIKAGLLNDTATHVPMSGTTKDETSPSPLTGEGGAPGYNNVSVAHPSVSL
jgi:hypothetical protein